MTSSRFNALKILSKLPSRKKTKGKTAIQNVKALVSKIISDRANPHSEKFNDLLEMLMSTKDEETGEVFFEIEHDGQEEIIVPGGRGGKGNNHFKSATQQTPRFAQPGEPGLEEWKILELKLLADVGLVGFPNAGKSTLLSVVSAAKPEIADYPFTTIVPNLGMVRYRDNQSFVMADIPGIIEGASEGRGLGTRFLRHIERNSVLLFMIPVDTKDIREEYKILMNELQQHNPELIDKRRVIAITKCDMIDDELQAQIMNEIPVDKMNDGMKVPVLFISAATNKGIVELKDVLWSLMNERSFLDRE
jgi:GTP-binding protein